MGAALAIRSDIEAEELRRLARLKGEGRIACRLLALANVLDGLSREAAAGRFFVRRAYSAPASLAGLPAVSVPCGASAAGLPIGLQIIGRAFDEATVLRTAFAVERSVGGPRRPPIDEGHRGGSP